MASWAGVLDPCEANRWLGRAVLPPGMPDAGPYWTRYRVAMEDFTRFQIRTGQWSVHDADAMLLLAWKRELEYFAARPEMERVVKTWVRWEGGYPPGK